MRTVLTIFAASILTAMPSLLAAARTPVPGVRAAAEETITGCLTKGSGNAYVLHASDGTTLSVTGPAELAEHLDQTVRLKGTMDRVGGTFKATAIDSIASSCSS